MTRVARTIIVKSAKLPRKVFMVFVELEGMYRNMVEQLVLYAVRNNIKSFTRLKALKYREMRSLYRQLPSHYVYTACQDASTRAKSFLRLEKLGLTERDYPEVRRVGIWLDDHLWKLNGLISIKIATHKGWITIEFEPHKQYWRYINRGWRLYAYSSTRGLLEASGAPCSYLPSYTSGMEPSGYAGDGYSPQPAPSGVRGCSPR